jgi:hypothetical protein
MISIRATGMPRCTVHRRERAHCGAERFGPAEQSQGDLGDHAERALGADEQPGQIVAGRRLARATAGANHASVGEDHRQPQNVVAHRPVADGRRARRTRCRHPANRRVGAGVDGEHQAGVLQVIVQLAMGQAGFDGDIEVFGRQADHPRHARKVDRDAAVNGVDVPLERAAHAIGDDGRARRAAHGHNADDVVCGFRKRNGVRRGGRMPRLAAAVMRAHRLRCRQAVAEDRAQLLDYHLAIRRDGSHWTQSL